MFPPTPTPGDVSTGYWPFKKRKRKKERIKRKKERAL